jgi:hypothetical protein
MTPQYSLSDIYAAKSLWWTRWGVVAALAIGIPTLGAAIVAAWPTLKGWRSPKLSELEKQILRISVKNPLRPGLLHHRVNFNSSTEHSKAYSPGDLEGELLDVTYEILELEDKGLIARFGDIQYLQGYTIFWYQVTKRGFRIARKLPKAG